MAPHARLATLWIVLLVSGCPRPSTRAPACSAETCAGCCQDGACLRGIAPDSCGSAGATCGVCSSSENCILVGADSSRGGRCSGVGMGPFADSGTPDAGAPSSTCGPNNCSQGCCSNSGVCLVGRTPSRCGRGGSICAICTAGQFCQSGLCEACSGCMDPNTGACLGGAEDGACGARGGLCLQCDVGAGERCVGGACQSSTTCSSTTCPSGCCDGTVCRTPAQWSDVQCGVGVGGAACVACVGSQRCEPAAGACVVPGGTGGGGGGSSGTGGGGGAIGATGLLSFDAGTSLWDGGVIFDAGVLAWTSAPLNMGVRGQDGTRGAGVCLPTAVIPSLVWGTGAYTDDSSLCVAAVHFGLFDLNGGALTFEVRPGLTGYAPSLRNGVNSASWGAWTGTYVFVP